MRSSLYEILSSVNSNQTFDGKQHLNIILFPFNYCRPKDASEILASELDRASSPGDFGNDDMFSGFSIGQPATKSMNQNKPREQLKISNDTLKYAKIVFFFLKFLNSFLIILV